MFRDAVRATGRPASADCCLYWRAGGGRAAIPTVDTDVTLSAPVRVCATKGEGWIGVVVGIPRTKNIF